MTDSSRQRAEDIVKDIQQQGSNAIAIQADIGKLSGISKLVDTTLKFSGTGKIEILVHKSVSVLSFFGLMLATM